MSETLDWVNNRLPNRRNFVKFCVLICLVNIVLVSVLAGMGVLRTAERGDVTYTKVEETPDGTFEIPADSPDQFAIERPTDVDAYYNMVVRYRNGGPMFNPWGSGDTIQKYHYFPLFYLIFLPLFYFGYFGFKLSWLALSIFATVGGSYIILRTELRSYDTELPTWQIFFITVSSAGFQPMITNFKVGQITPLIYFCFAIFWWLYQTNRISLSGAILVIPSLIKPYFMTPFVLLWKPSHWRGVIGFLATFVVANILTTLIFGSDILLNYYIILLDFIGNGISQPTGEKFVASSLKILFWLGDFAWVIYLLSAMALSWFCLVHIFNEESYATELFVFSLVSLIFMTGGTIGVTDTAALLAVFIILGVRFYVQNWFAFDTLSLSFALLHIHPYFVEATLGAGAKYIPFINQNQQMVSTIAPFLQPGIYSIFILYGVCFYAFRSPTGGLPVPQLGRWREVLGKAEQ